MIAFSRMFGIGTGRISASPAAGGTVRQAALLPHGQIRILDKICCQSVFLRFRIPAPHQQMIDRTKYRWISRVLRILQTGHAILYKIDRMDKSHRTSTRQRTRMTTVGKGLMHKTMAEAAASEIRERILGGAYPPGMRLRQDALAEEFGMSRIPIREALLCLESEGILNILPHRGAVVVELSVEEIEELFNMRVLLEPFLFLRSAPSLTPADFELLESNLEKYSASMDALDVDMWNDINTEFHMTIYKRARSPRVQATVQNLLAECDRHTRIQLTNITADRNRAVEEHTKILKLCRQRKFEEGAQLMREHIDHIRLVLFDLLKDRDADAGRAAE